MLLRALLIVTTPLFLIACSGEQTVELGKGSSVVTGSAGAAGAHQAHESLVHCDQPIATIALAENPNGYTISNRGSMPDSPIPLLRLLAQQSGCFRVVDRAAGLETMLQEQKLADQGITRQQNRLQKGMGLEAQYTLIPSLTFSENRAGGSISAIMAMIPFLSDFSGYAENVTFKEAQVALLLTDNQTTEQLAAATGSAKATDLGMGGLALVSGVGGLGAGWSNTNEGKVVVAAFLDAHNKLVPQIKAMHQAQHATSNKQINHTLSAY